MFSRSCWNWNVHYFGWIIGDGFVYFFGLDQSFVLSTTNRLRYKNHGSVTLANTKRHWMHKLRGDVHNSPIAFCGDQLLDHGAESLDLMLAECANDECMACAFIVCPSCYFATERQLSVQHRQARWWRKLDTHPTHLLGMRLNERKNWPDSP